MILWIQRLIWRLAVLTPQHEDSQNRWAKMHGRLMGEVSLQQKANRRKKSKLRGLRGEKMKFRCLGRLNSIHVEFLEDLQRTHPELNAEIEKHQNDRCNAC